MRIWINEDNMTWNVKVTINKMATTTISWDSASIPPFLDITINGTTDMGSVSSMELSGDADGLVVYEMPITATYKSPYKLWNITLEATSHREDVTFGISPSATDDYDVGIDDVATTPGGPEELWTQMTDANLDQRGQHDMEREGNHQQNGYNHHLMGFSEYSAIP
jgi:hypothetical protein